MKLVSGGYSGLHVKRQDVRRGSHKKSGDLEEDVSSR